MALVRTCVYLSDGTRLLRDGTREVIPSQVRKVQGSFMRTSTLLDDMLARIDQSTRRAKERRFFIYDVPLLDGVTHLT